MSESSTVLEAVVESLRDTTVNYHAGVEEPPVAVLWTDPDRSWKPLVEQLRQLMPELLELGDYEPAKRIGPVIWLKCAIAGTIPEIKWADGLIPVLYLPGVSRHELRNADQCPAMLQPLAELLYRGTVWAHRNGRDWTIEGFFGSEDGLGLDVAGDDATRMALRSSLSALSKTPLAQLQGRGRLDAGDFTAIVVGDTPRDLLTWLGAPEETRKEWGEERWYAFRSRCRDDFDFDPENELPIFAAEKLGKRETKAWTDLWGRFCEAPGLYGGVRDALDRAQPKDQLALDSEPWPAENAKSENDLREALAGLADVPVHQARQAIGNLEKQHAIRREWVWARLGEAPLAEALLPLKSLAESTQVIPSYASAEEFEQWYADAGWKTDAAVLRSLQALKNNKDEEAVHTAVRSLYAPWLEEVARRYQELVQSGGYQTPKGEQAEPGECLLFVDGLRLDVGHMLMDLLHEVNFATETTWRRAGLPTATPTAKPAVSPISEACSGATVPADFRPTGPGGTDLNSHQFAKAVNAAGYQWLKVGEGFEPSSEDAKGWLETGRIDSRGHDLGVELPTQLPSELKRVVSLVEELLAAGWKKVRIVTDHGWLLLPGGLAKQDLPGFLVESRWARCAAIKGASKPDAVTVPWRWNSAESLAIASGAKSFIKGESYAHGGVSPQECITPVIAVTAGIQKPVKITRITEVRWKRMRCSIELKSVTGKLIADIRFVAADASTSVLATSKEVEPDGLVSVLVKDPDLEGKDAIVVIAETDGTIIAKAETRIGG